MTLNILFSVVLPKNVQLIQVLKTLTPTCATDSCHHVSIPHNVDVWS